MLFIVYCYCVFVAAASPPFNFSCCFFLMQFVFLLYCSRLERNGMESEPISFHFCCWYGNVNAIYVRVEEEKPKHSLAGRWKKKRLTRKSSIFHFSSLFSSSSSSSSLSLSLSCSHWSILNFCPFLWGFFLPRRTLRSKTGSNLIGLFLVMRRQEGKKIVYAN